jgi:hypothetical protein
MNGYLTFYRDRKTEIYADTAYEAQKKAVDFFKPNKKDKHTITVHLCLRDGQQITHSTAGIG